MSNTANNLKAAAIIDQVSYVSNELGCSLIEAATKIQSAAEQGKEEIIEALHAYKMQLAGIEL